MYLNGWQKVLVERGVFKLSHCFLPDPVRWSGKNIVVLCLCLVVQVTQRVEFFVIWKDFVVL